MSNAIAETVSRVFGGTSVASMSAASLAVLLAEAAAEVSAAEQRATTARQALEEAQVDFDITAAKPAHVKDAERVYDQAMRTARALRVTFDKLQAEQKRRAQVETDGAAQRWRLGVDESLRDIDDSLSEVDKGIEAFARVMEKAVRRVTVLYARLPHEARDNSGLKRFCDSISNMGLERLFGHSGGQFQTRAAGGRSSAVCADLPPLAKVFAVEAATIRQLVRNCEPPANAFAGAALGPVLVTTEDDAA